jgi:acylphosphatase
MAWKAKIYGTVQNVGFRSAVKKRAQFLGLHGYVRNLDDGTVEIVLFEERNKLEQLIRSMDSFHILRVSMQSYDAKESSSGFEILYS